MSSPWRGQGLNPMDDMGVLQLPHPFLSPKIPGVQMVRCKTRTCPTPGLLSCNPYYTQTQSSVQPGTQIVLHTICKMLHIAKMCVQPGTVHTGTDRHTHTLSLSHSLTFSLLSFFLFLSLCIYIYALLLSSEAEQDSSAGCFSKLLQDPTLPPKHQKLVLLPVEIKLPPGKGVGGPVKKEGALEHAGTWAGPHHASQLCYQHSKQSTKQCFGF